MHTRTVTVVSKSGLHARPAALFTHAVAESGHDVTIAIPGGEPVDAASILMVMSLGIPCGGEVILSAEGEDAGDVLDDLVTMLATNLDEQR